MARRAQLAKRKAVAEDALVFLWQGTDKRGTKVKGELRARDTNYVRAELRRQGIQPLRVKKKPRKISLGETVDAKDIMLFTRQLSTMLNAGIALVQALDMVGNSAKKEKLKKLILSIKTEVEGGSRFADALAQNRYYFDDLYCSLVKSGEEAGVLDQMLDKIASHLEKTESIKSKVKKALLYPAIVVLAAMLITAVILIFVIPVFEELFQSFGADLPAFTRMVINISHVVQNWWWLMLFGTIGVIWGLMQARRRSKKFGHLLDRMILRLPIFGNIANLSANARFARTLSTMFAAGVPLVDAMGSVAGATGNVVYEEAVYQMRDSVSIGQQLNFAMRQSSLFPDMVVQMIAIGEEAGSLSDMLSKVADFYEEELDSTIAMLTTLIEPMIMMILGVLVGGLIIAMYLPIFKLAAAI